MHTTNESIAITTQQIVRLAKSNVDFVIGLKKEPNRLYIGELLDKLTYEHSVDVATYSYLFGSYLELSDRTLRQLVYAGLLHDLGKIGISPDILNKPAGLTKAEFNTIKRHPNIGIKMLEVDYPSAPAYLKDAVKHHHENWDGSGYPEGLKGKEVKYLTRIIHIIDAYCAITERRTYKKALSAQEAIKLMSAGRGTKWDPYLFDLFEKFIKAN